MSAAGACRLRYLWLCSRSTRARAFVRDGPPDSGGTLGGQPLRSELCEASHKFRGWDTLSRGQMLKPERPMAYDLMVA